MDSSQLLSSKARDDAVGLGPSKPCNALRCGPQVVDDLRSKILMFISRKPNEPSITGVHHVASSLRSIMPEQDVGVYTRTGTFSTTGQDDATIQLLRLVFPLLCNNFLPPHAEVTQKIVAYKILEIGDYLNASSQRR